MGFLESIGAAKWVGVATSAGVATPTHFGHVSVKSSVKSAYWVFFSLLAKWILKVKLAIDTVCSDLAHSA